MKTSKTFELVNSLGCYMEATQAYSFQEARTFFASTSKYEGNFKIIKSGGLTSKSASKNVRL